MPTRIQRKRTKGWRMPDGAVCVSRPSRWGNPYRVGAPHPDHGWPMSGAEAVECFRRWYEQHMNDRLLAPLRGKDLACWCPLDQPCHADVLLELANR